MKLKLLQIRESTGVKFNSPQELTNLLSEEGKADRECLWVLHMNVNMEIIEKELVAMGILNALLVHPREVFKKVILNSASSIALAHNHPSGNPAPSLEDKNILRKLNACGKILEIPITDFLIITPSGKFWSAKEEGLI